MANYFNIGVSGSSNLVLFSDISKLVPSSDFTFCIKLEDTTNYPSDYNLTYLLSNVSVGIKLQNGRGGATFTVTTSNDSKTFNDYPTYITLVVDSSNSELLIYADGVYLDSISDTFSISTSSNLLLTNDNSSVNNASFTELLFFNRVLNDDEAKLASVGFASSVSVTIDVGISQSLEIYQLPAVFPNVNIYADAINLNVISNDATSHINSQTVDVGVGLIISPNLASINEFGNVFVEVSSSIMTLLSLQLNELPNEYIVQQWTFIDDSGLPTKFDNNGLNEFTDSETTVKNDLPSILTITDEYLYYKPVWDDSNFDSGTGKPTVIGEAQLSGLPVGSKSFSFWIYRPFIAEVSNDTYILIDGDYSFKVTPDFGNETSINNNWSLVIIIYNKELNTRDTYVDNILYKSTGYTEISNGKFSLTTTEEGRIDTKVALHNITSYSYALRDSDMDAIYNYYYKIQVIRPEISSLLLEAPFTEGWVAKPSSGVVIAINQNLVVINKFINKYTVDIANTLTIIPNTILNLSEHISELRIIQNPIITSGEAYLDTQDTSLCKLYDYSAYFSSDKPNIFIDEEGNWSVGDWVGTFNINIFLIPFDFKHKYRIETIDGYSQIGGRIIDDSLYTGVPETILSSFDNSFSALGQYTIDGVYANRVGNRGTALSIDNSYIRFDVDASVHMIIFNISQAPTNYYILAVVDGYTLKIDSNMYLYGNGAKLLIQPLLVNKEYQLKFDLFEGIFINSYFIYKHDYSYLTDDELRSIACNFRYFGYSNNDTGADGFNGYICDYKVYTYAEAYEYNYYTTTGFGGGETVRLKEIPRKDRVSSVTIFPTSNKVYNKYKSVGDISSFNIISNEPRFVGYLPKSEIVKPFPSTLNVYQNFLKHPLHSKVMLKDIISLEVISNLAICDFVQVKATNISIISNCAIVNNNDSLVRVLRIDDIEFKKGLLLSSEFSKVDVRANSLVNIDGTTTLFVDKIKQFSRAVEIITPSRAYIDYATIISLKNIIDTNKHILFLSNGTYLEFYFNLKDIVLHLEDSYEGSKYFKINLKVII